MAPLLDQDLLDREEFFSQLDRKLEEQTKKINAQRRALAELRKTTLQNSQLALSNKITNTQEFDQSAWTLLTATGEIGADIATKMLDALKSDPLNELAGEWYREFEDLEGQKALDESTAEKLAVRITEFAEAVMETADISPANEDLPLMKLVEQLQAQTLSPAQQKVWAKLISRVRAEQDE